MDCCKNLTCCKEKGASHCEKCCHCGCCKDECKCIKSNIDIAQKQGDTTEAQGDLTQLQGDQAQSQGDQTQSQAPLTEVQGDQSQTQGDLSESQGNQSQEQGDLSESQGDLSESQGDQSQAQGDQSENQGDLSETQGDQMQSQGDLSETMGDLTQTQGGETLGDQTQGSQSQTSHVDQSQGEQTLTSSPSITTPVTVSGVNVNVTVNCGEEMAKQYKTQTDCCIKSIQSLFDLIKKLGSSINDNSNKTVTFYTPETKYQDVIGVLMDIYCECLFTVQLSDTEVLNSIKMDTLDAIEVSQVGDGDLFSLLLDYIENCNSGNNNSNTSKDDQCFNECEETIKKQLDSYMTSNTELNVVVINASITGYIKQICNGIVYMVDNVETPTKLYGIPLCKIVSYNPN